MLRRSASFSFSRKLTGTMRIFTTPRTRLCPPSSSSSLPRRFSATRRFFTSTSLKSTRFSARSKTTSSRSPCLEPFSSANPGTRSFSSRDSAEPLPGTFREEKSPRTRTKLPAPSVRWTRRLDSTCEAESHHKILSRLLCATKKSNFSSRRESPTQPSLRPKPETKSARSNGTISRAFPLSTREDPLARSITTSTMPLFPF